MSKAGQSTAVFDIMLICNCLKKRYVLVEFAVLENGVNLQIASNGNTSPISPKCGFNFIVFAFLTENSSLNH